MSAVKRDLTPYAVIFFDAGSVLFTTPTGRQQRIQQVLATRGYIPTEQAHALAVGDRVATHLKTTKTWLATWDDERRFWSAYYQAIAHHLPHTPPGFAEELFYLCHFVQHCQLYDDVLPTLDQLQTTYRFGVISNAYPSLDWVFDRLQLRPYFDHITISAFVGYAKPDPAIYQAALCAMQIDPTKAFFIDNKPANVAAARALGMGGVPLLRDAPAATQHLTTLRELPTYLQQ